MGHRLKYLKKGGHLEIKSGRHVTKPENGSIEFLDLKMGIGLEMMLLPTLVLEFWVKIG